MSEIHPTALVDSSAQLGTGVVVGPYCIIEAEVIVGDGTIIGPHAHLASGTRIGRDCRIFTGATLGSIPQDLKFGQEESLLVIGDRTTIREYATLNRGTKESGKTVIGSDCLLMAYSHVAHDCVIGDHCILANAVNLAGHVIIEDWASIGGMVPVHQFVRIGQHAFVGGGYRVPKDVPPYILAVSEPLQYGGLNGVGLKRRGFSDESLRQLKRAFRILYKSNRNVSQAVAALQALPEKSAEVLNLLAFIEGGSRGLIG